MRVPIRVPSIIKSSSGSDLAHRLQFGGPWPRGFICNLFLASSIGSTLHCCPTLQNVGRLLVMQCMRWIQRPVRQQREEALGYWSHEEGDACRSEALCKIIILFIKPRQNEQLTPAIERGTTARVNVFSLELSFNGHTSALSLCEKVF